MWYILEKVMSMQHSFEEFSEKQRRVELKSVGNFVAKTVLVESANQFLLEVLCRTQYSMKYFSRSHIDHQTYGKTFIAFHFELEGESRYVTKRTYPSSSETTKLQFHWSIIITSSYHYLFIEKVKSSELLIKQPRYGGSRRRTQIPWLATMHTLMKHIICLILNSRVTFWEIE